MRYFILCAMILFVCRASAQAVLLDRIVAVVNNEIITESELKHLETRALAGSLPQEVGKSGKPDRKELLRELIDRKIKLQKAKKLGIRVSGDAVNSTIQQILHRKGITKEMLEQKLRHENLSLADYKKEIQEQMILSRLFGQEIRSKIVILPEDLKQYYQDHLNRFLQKEKKRIPRILLAVPESATKDRILALKAEMEKLRKQIISGESFAELAIRYSDGPEGKNGGDLGYFTTGEVRSDLASVISRMKAGDVSPVLSLPEGFTLLKVEEVHPAQPIPFEEVRESLRKEVYQKKLKKRYEEWIRDLREKAYIEIKS